jgi:hypothetical protein
VHRQSWSAAGAASCGIAFVATASEGASLTTTPSARRMMRWAGGPARGRA